MGEGWGEGWIGLSAKGRLTHSYGSALTPALSQGERGSSDGLTGAEQRNGHQLALLLRQPGLGGGEGGCIDRGLRQAAFVAGEQAIHGLGRRLRAIGARVHHRGMLEHILPARDGGLFTCLLPGLLPSAPSVAGESTGGFRIGPA